MIINIPCKQITIIHSQLALQILAKIMVMGNDNDNNNNGSTSSSGSNDD